MKKFNIVRQFSLNFINDEWKDAYINFSALTVGDVKEKFPNLSKLDEKSQADPMIGLNSILDLLKSKFVSGKGVSEKKELVDLTVDDLEALPVEVLSKALSFLSQGVMPPSQSQ